MTEAFYPELSELNLKEQFFSTKIPSSKKSKNKFQFSIVNDFNYDLDIYWNDFNGNLILNNTIKSKKTFNQVSYSNNVWVLYSKSNSICIYFVLKESKEFLKDKSKVKSSGIKNSNCNLNSISFKK